MEAPSKRGDHCSALKGCCHAGIRAQSYQIHSFLCENVLFLNLGKEFKIKTLCQFGAGQQYTHTYSYTHIYITTLQLYIYHLSIYLYVVCLDMCMHTPFYKHIYTQSYSCKVVQLFGYSYICVYIKTQAHGHKYVHVCVCIRVSVCAQTHTHICLQAAFYRDLSIIMFSLIHPLIY